MARFEQERIDDFKNTLQVFLDGMISRQKEVGGAYTTVFMALALNGRCLQLISAWENYQQVLLRRVGGLAQERGVVGT
jgi:sorting nexin-1/2